MKTISRLVENNEKTGSVVIKKTSTKKRGGTGIYILEDRYKRELATATSGAVNCWDLAQLQVHAPGKERKIEQTDKKIVSLLLYDFLLYY
jgi:hypothetical protein